MAFLTVEHVLLSVLVNGVSLIAVFFLKTAPPRIVLWICVLGMLAIFAPWSSVGQSVESYASVAIVSSTAIQADALPPLETLSTSTKGALVTLWLVSGLGWLLVSITRSIVVTRQWRSVASSGDSLTQHANPAYASELRRTKIHRLPGSSRVFATGYFRPEIWIGDGVRSDAQIETALNHELAHIAANDQLTLLLLVAVERLLWWNPLVWILGRQARHHMEFSCDLRCKSLLGAATYRQALAELFLQQKTSTTALEVPLGTKSDVINRLEKIDMTHSLRPKHILALTFASALIIAASANLSAQGIKEPSTLLQCHELLPEGVQYDFQITSVIDTRSGQKAQLAVSLVDASQPNAQTLPEGAGAFLQCVQKVVGLAGESDWPEA